MMVFISPRLVRAFISSLVMVMKELVCKLLNGNNERMKILNSLKLG